MSSPSNSCAIATTGFFDASEKVGPRVAAALLERSILARAVPQGDILGFAPPLCLWRGEADIVVDAMHEAIKETGKIL